MGDETRPQNPDKCELFKLYFTTQKDFLWTLSRPHYRKTAKNHKLALVETRDDEAFVFMCEFLRADLIFYPFTKQKTRTCVRVSDDGQNELRVSDTSKTSIHRMVRV